MGTPAFVVSGDLTFDGITYETALASVDVFVAAVADLCGVDASLVSVDISQARRRHLRRRLDDAGSVVVTYTVAVETEAAAASVSTLIEDSSTEDVSAAVKKAATEAGADEDFADVETTAVGTPTTALAPQPDDDAPTTGASAPRRITPKKVAGSPWNSTVSRSWKWRTVSSLARWQSSLKSKPLKYLDTCCAAEMYSIACAFLRRGREGR